jgi:hypothetical protein
MTDYIIDEEQRLSPTVIVSTTALVAVFVIGFLFQLISLVL